MTLYCRTPRFALHRGDCRYILPTLPENSVDSIAVDPPYELGFMQRGWDRTGIAFDIGMWRESLRVLKPGGHLISFGGTRTYHRMACAVEDAGFEVRDQLIWIFGSGFPKSLDIERAIDTKFCVQPGRHYWTVEAMPNDDKARKGDHVCDSTAVGRQHEGEGTALKPAHEPIMLARKPLDGTLVENVLRWRTGALNIDACRVAYASDADKQQAHVNALGPVERAQTSKAIYEGGKQTADFADTHSEIGRWPANMLHDGSAEVVDVLAGRERYFYCPKATKQDRDEGLDGLPARTAAECVDRTADSAGMNSPRAGAGRTSGTRNHHPTVKPTSLMRYLCRLITPPGGTVLDQMAGSFSTGKATMLEGFEFVGIELDTERDLMEIGRFRMMHAAAIYRQQATAL